MIQAQLLRDGNVYENGNFSVRYYTEEQFLKYKTSANIVGSVYLRPEIVENEQERLLVQTPQNEVFQLRINAVNPKEKTFGYIYLGNLDFIKIVEENSSQNKKLKVVKPKKGNKIPMIIVISIALITCIGIGLFLFFPKNEEYNPEPTQTPEITTLSISNETTDIPLYVSFNLTKSESKINLSNPEGNTVDFVYEIYNEEKLLFSTDKIIPGSQNTVDMSQYLESGEYNLVFKIRCFLGELEVNGTEEPVKVVME